MKLHAVRPTPIQSPRSSLPFPFLPSFPSFPSGHSHTLVYCRSMAHTHPIYTRTTVLGSILSIYNFIVRRSSRTTTSIPLEVGLAPYSFGSNLARQQSGHNGWFMWLGAASGCLCFRHELLLSPSLSLPCLIAGKELNVSGTEYTSQIRHHAKFKYE